MLSLAKSRLSALYPTKWLVWLLPLVLAYAMTSRFIVKIFSEANNVSLVWPLSGVALAWALLGGRRMLPLIWLSEMIGNLLADLPPLLSIALALSVVIETSTCHWLLTNHTRFDDGLRRTQDFIALSITATLGAAMGGMSAIISFIYLDYPSHLPLLITFVHWWQGDMLGIILITPLILVWRDWPDYWRGQHHMIWMLVLFACALLVGQLAYLGWMETLFADHARAYWSFLFITAAAVGFGRHGVLLIIVLTAGQVLLGHVLKVGTFRDSGLQDIWFFLVILTIVGVALALNVEERIQREAEWRVSQRTLKALMQRNEQVREEERQHIAREIHDELGQVLTAIKMHAALLARTTPHSESWRDDIKQLLQLIDGCIKVVRNIALHLRPPILALGLGPALQWLADQFAETHGIVCKFATVGDTSDVQEPYLTTLFRLTQEALTNIARHAKAREVSIKLTAEPERFCLIVSDNGQGFDVQEEMKAGNSLGLNGMLQRVEMLDGQFEIHSTQEGTILQCRLPVHNTGAKP